MSLAEDAAAARKLGMTYGKYMTIKIIDPSTPKPVWHDPRETVCPGCGRTFIKTKSILRYCGAYCQMVHNNRIQDEKRRAARQARKEKQNG